MIAGLRVRIASTQEDRLRDPCEFPQIFMATSAVYGGPVRRGGGRSISLRTPDHGPASSRDSASEGTSMTEHTPVLYTATAVNRTGPDGESLTDSGWRVTVQSPGPPPAAPTAAAGTAGADAPAATPGRSEHATNPEELLALAWATCLSGSARIVAPGRDVTVRVEVA